MTAAAPRSALVAVVDDDERVLESLQSLLESAGLSVRVFGSAGTFLAAQDLADNIDVLISDIGMPTMDGHELKRIMLSRRPELAVILLTGRDGALPAQSALSTRGYQDYFLKPFSGRGLLAAIEIAIQPRQVKGPEF
jgi:FixJ family two-component response regulator